MKVIFATQRVDALPERGERRDALDGRWAEFLLCIDCMLLPVPNNVAVAKELLLGLRSDGILLTGGNSPASYGGDAPERDEVDTFMIEQATKNKKPMIGVCRGMQSIICHFGGTLKHTDGHVAVRHGVDGNISREVNSYHSLAVDMLPACFEIIAQTEDGIIEAVRHRDLPIMAIMWHPEREATFCSDDLLLIKDFWKG